MATISAAGFALRRHVIPLLPSTTKEKEESTTVALTRNVPLAAGGTEKRKYNVPQAHNQDVEALCRCVLEFRDVAAVQRLNLSTGPLRFAFFRQCLTGVIRDQWDNIVDGMAETVANHATAIQRLMATLIRPTDLADQRHYLETSKKPFKMSCATLAARLETINKMMSLFPGTDDNPPLQPLDLKNLFYQMMPLDWQRAFLNSGQVITEPTYTLLSLQRFMTLQEEQNALDVQRRRLRTPNQRQRPRTRQYQQSSFRGTPRAGRSSPMRPFQRQPPYHNPYGGFQRTFIQQTPNRPPFQGTRPPFRAQMGRGRGRGRARAGRPDAFATQQLPPSGPTVARPSSSPPDDFQFNDEEQEYDYLPAPETTRWVTGATLDSNSSFHDDYYETSQTEQPTENFSNYDSFETEEYGNY